MDFINLLLPKIEHLGLWGYWIVFFSSFMESLAFIGLIFPGVIFLIFFGFLSSTGYLDIGDIFWFAAIGSILGETISYYLGKKGKKIFAEEKKIFSLSNLEKGERFIKKHGNKSVFLARFVGPMRPIIPFMAGLFKMNARQFFIWNILGAFCWAAFYSFIGYFFGQAWRAIGVWSTRIGIFFLAIAVVMLIFYFSKQFIIKQGKHFFIFFKTLSLSIWKTITANSAIKKFIERHPVLISFLRNRFTTKKFIGLPLTFLIFIFIYASFLILEIINGILKNGMIAGIDAQFANFLYEYRHPIAVKIFLWVTVIEEWQIMIFIIFILTILFIILKKKVYIVPLYVSSIGGIIFSGIGKMIIKRIRPEGFIPVYIEDSFSFPSSHATIAVAVFGVLAYFFIVNAKNLKTKINIAFGCLIFIALIGLSRLYLGVHYLSDILGGYLLGLLWLIIAIFIFEWRGRKNSPILEFKTISVKTKIIFFVIGIIFVIYFIVAGNSIMPQVV